MLVKKDYDQLIKASVANGDFTDSFPVLRCKYDIKKGGYLMVKNGEDTQTFDKLIAQPVISFFKYSYYDVDQNKVLYETSDYLPGQEIILYNYVDQTYEKFESSKDFKEKKNMLKELGINLKFMRTLYLKAEDGTIYRMYLKLSQTHGYDENKGYLLNDPMPNTLGHFLNEYKDGYVNQVCEITVDAYQGGSSLIPYPLFKVVKSKQADIKTFETVLNNITAINLAKISSLTLADDETEFDIQDATTVEDLPSELQ